MPYVVTDLCTGCRYTECVSVCPVECFHVDDTMTYIDPQNCIDCGGCVPARGSCRPNDSGRVGRAPLFRWRRWILHTPSEQRR